ncbi:hypothetical protein Pcac1_g17383 [Phytophthora cactorum]|uniref:Uncharacterized protein n=1 Tax=Phytophthora cactorum TaxID=29920 RepID=A0A8T1CJG3_9STRA|nr:hypothetical protein Pcac1_g17383 [Phytophthora cactorum]KAG2924115.1 hypothetical protein PC117_g15478 [Phytophthora cactorum]
MSFSLCRINLYEHTGLDAFSLNLLKTLIGRLLAVFAQQKVNQIRVALADWLAKRVRTQLALPGCSVLLLVECVDYVIVRSRE